MEERSFFKVFLPSISSERLCIPSAFVARVAIPDEAFLRNCHGKVWPMKVTKDGNCFHFGDGWRNFVEDNSLEFGEFLVFDYDGTGEFYAKSFGRNACLNEVVGSSYLNGEEEEEKEDNDDNEDDNYDDDDEEEEEEEEEEDMERGDAVVTQKLESTTLRNGNRGKAAIDDVFEHGIVSRPKNPYFVTKLREKRSYELCVPKDVIQCYRLKLPEKLILLDEEGRTWSSKVKGPWGDGRTWLNWRLFCKWNSVKREDRCLCEFMLGEGSEENYLKIRVLREGSWLPEGKRQPDSGH